MSALARPLAASRSGRILTARGQGRHDKDTDNQLVPQVYKNECLDASEEPLMIWSSLGF